MGIAFGATPQRMRRHERDIQCAFRQRRRDLVVIQLMKGKNYIRMLVAPGRQQRLQRLPNRRHPDTQSNMPGHSGPAALSDLQHAIDVVESSPDLDHDLPAGCCKANPKGPSLEYRDAKLILQADDASADRRRFDAQRLRSVRKTAGFDRDR